MTHREPRDWTAAAQRARAALDRNRALIESHPRGTPGQKPSEWRLRKAVGAHTGGIDPPGGGKGKEKRR